MAVCSYIQQEVFWFPSTPNSLSQQKLRVNLYFSVQFPKNQCKSLPLHFSGTSSMTSQVWIVKTQVQNTLVVSCCYSRKVLKLELNFMGISVWEIKVSKINMTRILYTLNTQGQISLTSSETEIFM